MRVLITGVTGLLGSHLTLELLRRHWDTRDRLHMVFLGRGAGDATFDARVRDVFLNIGPDYLGDLGAADQVKAQLKRFYRRNVTCLTGCLNRDTLGLGSDALATLKAAPIDQVFHAASITDLRDTPHVRLALGKNVVGGTDRLLDLAAELGVPSFNYVSTAFVCGAMTGIIKETVSLRPRGFRNLFEHTKHVSEQRVVQKARHHGMRLRVFRPSMMCGRLLDGQIGWTSKFDVFYGWASFFLRERQRLAGKTHSEPKGAGAPMRIACAKRAGLNIVPVDYCAKLITAVAMQPDLTGVFHVTNDATSDHQDWIPQVLNAIKFDRYALVDARPLTLSAAETRYYRCVGGLFDGYLRSDPMVFDTANTRDLRRDEGLACPDMSDADIARLMPFAIKHHFGLSRAATH